MTNLNAFTKSTPSPAGIGLWGWIGLCCVVLLVLLRLEQVIQTRLPINQTGDFAYHFAAIQTYVSGVGPYGADYTALLTETFPGYPEVAYFYPPQALALLLPFAVFDIGLATEMFFRLNALCLILGVVLCWLWVAPKHYLAGSLVTGLVSIPLVAGLAAPAMSSLLNSNFSNILLVGFALWARGGLVRASGLQGVGLAILMLKPSVGLVILLVSLLVPAYRRAALIAIAITAGLYLIGSAYTNPFAALFDYLHALSDYGDYSGNTHGNLIGIFAFIPPSIAEPGLVLSVAASVAAALLAIRLGQGNTWKIGLLAFGVTLVFSPMHLYDMVLLVPALFLALTRGDVLVRAVLLVGMLAIILGARLGALGFDAGLQFQTVLLALVTLAMGFLRPPA